MDGAYCLATGIKTRLGTAADILFMHVLEEREFTVMRHGRIEPVRIDDFDELDVFEEFFMALFRTNTGRR